MSEVKRLNFTVSQFESVVPYASEHGQYVRYTDYAKLAAEAQALREEVVALRMARDDFKLERDLARQNFCDEQAANYQLQAHLKDCLGELSELRARAVVPLEFLERIRSQLNLRAEFDQTYQPETQPVNDDARLFLELRALLSEQDGGKP
ncbi:hypothetical protein [Pseudomonas aeruginosa]|uniref:hypothetical protein n=1 Tax=Pseudomonas aeruginosa TaxID=287 RepID=UPI0004494211|nr:hypothetical protein [Pseudomonas aeruginosa]KAJ17389.1 hypothetical protein M003_29855 [Pseudomonas aeruginosa IGB83]